MPERKLVYESLRHKANAGFLVKAPSMERLYIDSALALMDQMVSLDLIKDHLKETLITKGESREDLMEKWLNEILLLFHQKKFLPKRITFQKFDGKQIQATFFGDSYEPLRHGTGQPIKTIQRERIQMGELHEQDLNFFAKVLLDV